MPGPTSAGMKGKEMKERTDKSYKRKKEMEILSIMELYEDIDERVAFLKKYYTNLGPNVYHKLSEETLNTLCLEELKKITNRAYRTQKYLMDLQIDAGVDCVCFCPSAFLGYIIVNGWKDLKKSCSRTLSKISGRKQ